MGSHRVYKISPEQRKEFVALYLLFEMVENRKTWNVTLARTNDPLTDGDDLLEPYLSWLVAKGYAQIQGVMYTSTPKGAKVIEKFNERDADFIRRYDIFCAVDTDQGEFAFERMMDLTDDQWSDYLQDNRWVDLRTVVCEFHKIDPIHMMFISFVRDGIINCNYEDWQFELCMGNIFNEMEDIINSMFNLEDFAVEDENGQVILSEGEHIGRYLEKANDVMQEVAQRREDLENEDHGEDDFIEDEEAVETVTTTTTTTTTGGLYDVPVIIVDIDPYDDWYFYQNCYTDVHYVSPCWGGGLYIDIY
jgi:hypothetical protein